MSFESVVSGEWSNLHTPQSSICPVCISKEGKLGNCGAASICASGVINQATFKHLKSEAK